jgi:hypothetical protein
MLRRGEMRLPRAKVHQLRALRAQLRGFRGHSHGGGYLNPPDPLGEN